MTSPTDTFFQAWGTSDGAERAALINSAVTDTVVYADPQAPDPITGPEALAAYVSMFSANAPGWSASVVRSDTIGGMTRATVAFGGPGPDGQHMAQHGQYFVEFDDGKICRMTGFVGTGEPESD